ncbi:ABC transporter ATP-binding protein [Candidatus Palauibacter sp.]|uniref:ABC transporter ATP-binding protein n=1 Tax=Candidatus Palauibacter sp. TaxID=3101350 RepID=UPI003D0DD451
MVRDPGVFLFDEPLSNLDAELRLRTRDEIAALHRRLGTTMIFVTHDQVEALSLGQRVAVMDRGRLHQVGTPEEVYRRPANLFVAGFVGSPPINRIALARDDAGRLAGGPFTLRAPSGVDRASLGVRPEDLAVARTREGEGEAAGFRATVLRVEALGSEQRVHLDGPGDAAWVARAPPALRVDPGDRVSVSVAWERSHLFGPDGRREEAAPRPMDPPGSR